MDHTSRQNDELVKNLSHRNEALEHEVIELKQLLMERDRRIQGLEQSFSWQITAPLRWLMDLLLAPNTKRRLFFILCYKMLTQPRIFFRHVSVSSFRYFFHYLLTTNPALIENMVDAVLTQEQEAADKAINTNTYFLLAATASLPAMSPTPRAEPVDIIVPIYNAPDLTAACITSVLANTENCRLILINDASTDERIRPLVDGVRSIPEKQIEVIIRHNEHNLGFVKTVNFASTLTKGHFVILNSDTEVPHGWLERLMAPILAEPQSFASVTPFSNAGMACSFPEPFHDFSIFKDLTVNDLDSYFSRYGSPKPIDIFTGVGFCMAFNRAVFEQIGLFDEETFGKGYGEECDWSLRAYEAGFRNVMLTNVFVYHKHGGSFSSVEKAQLVESNLKKFWEKYSTHMSRHQDFAALDMPRPIRDTLAILVDAQTKGGRNRVAILDVDMAGGGTIYSASLAMELHRSGSDVVHCKYNYREGYLKVCIESTAITKTLILPRTAAEKLNDVLIFLGVDFIIVNELFSWPDPLGIMGLLSTGTTPYLVLAHDFFMVCPSWFLIDQNGSFCDIPHGFEACNECLRENAISGHRGVYGGNLEDIQTWRSQVMAFLARAQAVTCFSQATIAYFIRTYPELKNITLQEHSIPNRDRFAWRQRSFDGTQMLNLGIIGNLYHIKGEKIVKELLDSPRFRNLPVKLTVYGESPMYPAGFSSSDGKVSFLGSYKQDALPGLLERDGINAILIPSIWPETFSYTTSEAILLGYPILCFNLGAQADRVRKYSCGIVMCDISTESVLDAIEQLLQNPRLIEDFSRNAHNYAPTTPDEHFGALIEVIKQSTRVDLA